MSAPSASRGGDRTLVTFLLHRRLLQFGRVAPGSRRSEEPRGRLGIVTDPNGREPLEAAEHRLRKRLLLANQVSVVESREACYRTYPRPGNMDVK